MSCMATQSEGKLMRQSATSLDDIEQRWIDAWRRSGVYEFDPRSVPNRESVFSIDTPPPTASGLLHVGHVFSFTHTDVIARFWRMRGKQVFYPMGYDDSGLPTERRVQRYFGVQCEPDLPYDPDFRLPSGSERSSSRPVPIDRRNFSELCARLTHEDETRFATLFRRLGLSCDFNRTYSTIGPESQVVSQRTFLRELRSGAATHVMSAGLWDVTFQTALAQADVVHRDYTFERFHVLVGASQTPEPLEIRTARPELLVSAVALLVHPNDARFRHLVGTTAQVPLFGHTVPIIEDTSVDPDAGSGVALCSTFEDLDDVRIWQAHQLPLRQAIGRNGHFPAKPPAFLDTPQARRAYELLGGRTTTEARSAVAEQLRLSGFLTRRAEIVHGKAKFYEQGELPLEVFPNRLWQVANGARSEDIRTRLIRRAEELRFHPESMRVRLNNWIAGLSEDWVISRQRTYGIPIPVWYPIDMHGVAQYDAPLLPDDADLPIDPKSAVPAGYDAEQRGEPGGFIEEDLVLDVWATTSVTPQIVGGAVADPELFEKVFPFDLRPQGQDIIRTWLFSSILRADRELESLPWTDAAISGWVLDPEGEKMSKSRGNAVPPAELFDSFGTDAVRFWSASKPLGSDANLNVAEVRNGRRLAQKLLNLQRLVDSLPLQEDDRVAEELDLAVVGHWDGVVRSMTASLEAYDHDKALRVGSRSLLRFSHDYVEMVKHRARSSEPASGSARAALAHVLDVSIRLLAPFLPFATEEAWSRTHSGSVHGAPWPVASGGAGHDGRILEDMSKALRAVRGARTRLQYPGRQRLPQAVLWVPNRTEQNTAVISKDLARAERIDELRIASHDSAEFICAVSTDAGQTIGHDSGLLVGEGS